jgi:hypothetical protein
LILTEYAKDSLLVLADDVNSPFIGKQIQIQPMHQANLVPWIIKKSERVTKWTLQRHTFKQTYSKESIPTRINEPRIPEYCAGTLIVDVRMDTAASVKKKFQCTPYSPTWTYKEKWADRPHL